jgi:hypothetical protein
MKSPDYKKPDKNHSEPFFRYGGFSISMNSTEKYPNMVRISRGPKNGSDLIGRNYVNHTFATKVIDTFKTERLIKKQFSTVVSVLDAEGYDVDAAVEAVAESEL